MGYYWFHGPGSVAIFTLGKSDKFRQVARAGIPLIKGAITPNCS